METDMGTCFPIHVVFVPLKDSSWTQIDSKSNIAKFFEKLSLTCVLDTERVQLVKDSFSDWLYVPRIDVFYSFTANG